MVKKVYPPAVFIFGIHPILHCIFIEGDGHLGGKNGIDATLTAHHRQKQKQTPIADAVSIIGMAIYPEQIADYPEMLVTIDVLILAGTEQAKPIFVVEG